MQLWEYAPDGNVYGYSAILPAKMNRYVVKIHRPIQLVLAVIGLSTIIAVITWFILDKSHWSVIYNNYENNRVFKSVLEENRNLEESNRNLRENASMMKEMDVMDKKTAGLLQDQIRKLQDEIFKLKQELEFYRGVMDGARESSGLNIQGMNIKHLATDNSYRLNLVLTHVAKSVKVAQGTVDVTLEGEQNGKPGFLKLRDVALDKNLDLSLTFRNFKKFECDLMLPESFTPIRVKVVFTPKDTTRATVKKTFDWSVS